MQWKRQALVTAAQDERSAAVRRAYAQAVAQLACYAPEPRVAKLTTSITDMYSHGSEPC